MTIKTAMYNGQQLRLSEIARLTGHRHSTILDRYDKGDRGPQLWRPLDQPGPGRKGVPRDANEAQRVERKRIRREQLAQALARARAAHALACAPLGLAQLTARERDAIQQRVKHCGQRSWRTTGATL